MRWVDVPFLFNKNLSDNSFVCIHLFLPAFLMSFPKIFIRAKNWILFVRYNPCHGHAAPHKKSSLKSTTDMCWLIVPIIIVMQSKWLNWAQAYESTNFELNHLCLTSASSLRIEHDWSQFWIFATFNFLLIFDNSL